MSTIWIVLGIAAVVFVLLAISYNRFASQTTLMANSWANVDTELRRRHDLVPNLVETVRGYAGHEQRVLVDVTEARAARHARRRARAPSTTGMKRHCRARCTRSSRCPRRYPELKASGHFLDLQHQLVVTEDRIQASRRLYNADVRDYNRRVASFPSMLVARIGRYKKADYFELEPSVRDVVPDVRT